MTSAAKKYQQIFDLLEELDYVERYVPYQDDLWFNAMLYSDGWPTPAGFIFRDYASSHAYKAEQQFIPVWWKPSLKDVTLAVSGKQNADGEVTFVIGNPNGDMTGTAVIQYRESDGSWTDVWAEPSRAAFDTNNYNVTVSLTSLPYGEATFRLVVTTLLGAQAVSPSVTCELSDTGVMPLTEGAGEKPEVYDLAGRRVADDAAHGFVILRTPSQTRKVVR